VAALAAAPASKPAASSMVCVRIRDERFMAAS
jgi:hypothetical protein